MSQEPTQTTTASTEIPCSFWARKLHSLSGVVPIGAFLVEHFWTNSYAMYGAESFNQAVERLHSMPYLVFVEIGVIGLPILYHSLYGLVITLQGRPNSLQYMYARNWMYLLQRITGVILFVYIGLHVYEQRIESALTGQKVTFEYVANILSEPGMFVLYVTGVLSAVFHFANGLWAFLIGWGLTVTEKAMKRSAYFCVALGVGMAIFGINALLGFLGKSLVIHF